MRCPSCGGPGGIQLLYTVSICTRCENGKRMRDAPAGLTMADLGVKPEGRVRFVPIDTVWMPPKDLVCAGIWSPSLRDKTLVSLNSGVNDPTLEVGNSADPDEWVWTWKASSGRPCTVCHGIGDMGPDESKWIKVPNGVNWGQRK